MKYPLAATALVSLLATQAGAITLAEFTTTTTGEAEWNATINTVAGTVTYQTTIKGNYDIELNLADILAAEGGALSVITRNTDWCNQYGIGVVSNTNPFGQANTGVPHMAFYVRNPVERVNHYIEFYLNTHNYTMNGTEVVNKVTMPSTVYSQAASTAYGNGAKLSFGFTLTAAWSDDGSTLTGLKFATPSDMDAQLSTGYVILPNMGSAFDLTRLTSYGAADNGVTYGISNDAETTITITKAWDETAWVSLPDDNQDGLPNYVLSVSYVPEPATATLGLLALAALASRRRRPRA